MIDFNTSNVTIQPGRVRKELQARVYFNTSNVTIQPNTIKDECTFTRFQYI